MSLANSNNAILPSKVKCVEKKAWVNVHSNGDFWCMFYCDLQQVSISHPSGSHIQDMLVACDGWHTQMNTKDSGTSLVLCVCMSSQTAQKRKTQSFHHQICVQALCLPVSVLTFIRWGRVMKLLTISYEGLALVSMLPPIETIITGPMELTPAKEVGSSRFWREGKITSLHYNLNSSLWFE